MIRTIPSDSTTLASSTPTKEAPPPTSIAPAPPEVPKMPMPVPVAPPEFPVVAPVAPGGQGFLMPQFQVDPNGSPEAQAVVQRGLNGDSAVRGVFLY